MKQCCKYTNAEILTEDTCGRLSAPNLDLFMHMLTIAPLQIMENLCKQSETTCISPFRRNELERSVHNRNALQWYKPILGNKRFHLLYHMS